MATVQSSPRPVIHFGCPFIDKPLIDQYFRTIADGNRLVNRLKSRRQSCLTQIHTHKVDTRRGLVASYGQANQMNDLPERMEELPPTGVAHEITRLLGEWSGGQREALEHLTPLVYGELRRLAASYLRRERPGHSIQPTALVHEAYMRLVDQRNQDWTSRSHFYGVAAHLMRLILVDHSRKKATKKRSAGRCITFDEAVAYSEERAADLVALDDALTALAAFDERKAKIIELRFFGGFTIDETARAMAISTATVERETRIAQMWIMREMQGEAMT
jgi:RNA polymerase sigma-70 factor (ECF subfamily)